MCQSLFLKASEHLFSQNISRGRFWREYELKRILHIAQSKQFYGNKVFSKLLSFQLKILQR